ncbi:MAG: DUF882 domain-containing protein [bacterium]
MLSFTSSEIDIMGCSKKAHCVQSKKSIAKIIFKKYLIINMNNWPRLIAYFTFFVLFLLCVTPARATTLPHDGKLRLYVYHVNEFLEVTYLDENGQWIDSAYEKINYIYRSRGDEQVGNIDKRLIELADHVQDHFNVDTIEVISGYRSPVFNKSLKDTGHNVANESLHTKGLASDIHIDEIKETTLRDYLLGIKQGGVGYYGDKLMVHMDFGPARAWYSGNFRENTEVGLFNEKSSIKIRTSKLYYNLHESQDIVFDGIHEKKKWAPHVVLQKFHRGQWVTCSLVEFRLYDNRKTLIQSWKKRIVLEPLFKNLQNMSPFGKFRWRYEYGNTWQYSNEFYVKKL